MKFNKQNDKWYPEFYVSDNNYFGIGIAHELFGRFKIQVMYRDEVLDNPEEVNWWVVREYVTYDKFFLISQMGLIFESLKECTVEGEDWKKVEELLPENKYKYLEDEFIKSEK